MDEFISRKAAIAYIREQSEECQKAFEELGGESGIYADAYNDLAEDFYSIPTADVVPVVRCMDCKHLIAVNVNGKGIPTCRVSGMKVAPNEFCSRGEKGRR